MTRIEKTQQLFVEAGATPEAAHKAACAAALDNASMLLRFAIAIRVLPISPEEIARAIIEGAK